MKHFICLLSAGILLITVLPLTLAAGGNDTDLTALSAAASTTRIDSVRIPPVWLKDGARAVQPVTVTISHTGPQTEGCFFVNRSMSGRYVLRSGTQAFELKLPASNRTRNAALSWRVNGRETAVTNLVLAPPRIRQVWLLPHSHVDIGYTDRQEKVVKHQIGNLEKGMELARTSAGNAPGMRFKWNVEAAWTVDHFLQEATPAQRDEFVHAVKAGQVEVDTLYANLLTELCRPEELAQSFAFGTRLSSLTGRPQVTAMLCDVPGYTWGLVPMFAQAGVKYFAMGPNASARIGTIHLWDNKPFYWYSQSGRDRVLCWMVDNYHHFGDLEPQILALTDHLNHSDFPYDMAYMFWIGRWPDGGVDNAPPDLQLVDKVLAWNAKYAAPRAVIGLESEFFGEFGRRHGAQTPAFSGDITPYWDDGAGSTSRETAMNRASGDRLAQASALIAISHAGPIPSQFNEAWKNEMLYSEHTWGAYCSTSKPDDPFTLDQWKVKQNFALQADEQSRQLLSAALLKKNGPASSVDVFNTTQWSRTDLAVVPADLAPAGMGGVTEENGEEIPCQHLASGEWVFVARDVAPFAAKRFCLGTQPGKTTPGPRVDRGVLETSRLRVQLDSASGAVKSLRLAGLDHEFVDPKAAVELNDFRYVLGSNSAAAQASGPVTITVLDSGPILATLRIESDAPGCNHLMRDVRVVEVLDQVEFIDAVDRKSVREKDAVHFGFGFNIPGGTVRMETPWAVVRPNADQLPASCRNWFAVQRWVDVSGNDYGITWGSLDAPLLEIGAMTANLMDAVPIEKWLPAALNSQTIYSWTQNNHWFTNYKIDQPGLTTFRFVLRPHQGAYSAAEAARFGLETTRPLLVAAALPRQPVTKPLLTVSPSSIIVETMKISDDGEALILRLFNVSDTSATLKLHWGSIKPVSIWHTDLTEKPLKRAAASMQLPGHGVLSLRAKLP